MDYCGKGHDHDKSESEDSKPLESAEMVGELHLAGAIEGKFFSDRIGTIRFGRFGIGHFDRIHGERPGLFLKGCCIKMRFFESSERTNKN